MRTIISKVDQMKAQRRTLEQDLREAVRRDDITTSLAQRGNKDTDKIFQTEIKKHEKTVEYIRQVSSCKFFLYEYIKIMGVGKGQSREKVRQQYHFVFNWALLFCFATSAIDVKSSFSSGCWRCVWDTKKIHASEELLM